jgi:hypothetical protein
MDPSALRPHRTGDDFGGVQSFWHHWLRYQGVGEVSYGPRSKLRE